MFAFETAKYNLIIIKSYLLTILFNDWEVEPTIIRKVNQFISFKFIDNQLFR